MFDGTYTNYIDAVVYIGIAVAGWVGSKIQSQITQNKKTAQLAVDVANLIREKTEATLNVKSLADEFRAHLNKQDDVLETFKTELTTIKTCLTGITGQNGLVGDMKELKKQIEKLPK